MLLKQLSVNLSFFWLSLLLHTPSSELSGGAAQSTPFENSDTHVVFSPLSLLLAWDLTLSGLLLSYWLSSIQNYVAVCLLAYCSFPVFE